MSDESRSSKEAVAAPAEAVADPGSTEPVAAAAIDAPPASPPVPESGIQSPLQDVPAFGVPRVKPPRPILGSTLWVSGVLLWAYLVMGIFTTTRLPFMPKKLPVEEGTAVFLVLAATGAAAYFAVKRSLEITQGGDPGPRAVRIVLGAIVLFVVFVFLALVLGVVGFPGPLLTLLLIVGSALACFLGRRLASRGVSVPDGNRFLAIAVWVAAAVVTINAVLLR